MDYWKREAEGAKQVLRGYREQSNAMAITGAAKQKISQVTADAEQMERKHASAVDRTKKQMEDQADAAKKTEDNIHGIVTQVERWVAQMLIMRGLTNMWRDMTEYAASYYDAMNEIRIVTG